MAEEEKKESKTDTKNLYIPRKCSWTHKLLPATDRGSVQINVAILDDKGVYSGDIKKVETFAFMSKVRSDAQSDKALSKLCYKKGLLPLRM